MASSKPNLWSPPTLRRSERISNLKRKHEPDTGDNSAGTPNNNKKSRPPKLTVSGTRDQVIDPVVTMNTPDISPIKQEANKLFAEKKYDLALKKYTLIIAMCPTDPIIYSNRAACYMMLENYSEGLKDAKKSVELSSTFIKGHCRVIKCALKLHEFEEMDSSAAKLKQLDPTNDVLRYMAQQREMLIQHLAAECRAVNAKDYEKALEHLEQSLSICPQFLMYRAKKAKYLAKICSFGEAETLASEILGQDSHSSDAHYALARCLYEKDIEKSVYHYDEAFRLDNNCDTDKELHQQAKYFLEQKAEANDAYKAQNFARAHDLYDKLLKRGKLNKVMKVTLLSNMSQASYKLGKLDDCLAECQKVFNLDPRHLKTLKRRAQCRMDLKDYERAIEDLQSASSIESSADILEMLKEARRLLKAAENDFYVILGVKTHSPWEVITKAYKELTKIHHPDRHSNATLEDKQFHEKKCKDITRAYRSLKEDYERQGKLSGFNNHHNASKKSSGGCDDKSNGPKTSSDSSNDCNGQKSSANGANNNFNGPKTSSENSDDYNGQKSSSNGENNNPNEPKRSPQKSNKTNGQSCPSDGAKNTPNGQPSSSKGPGANSNGHPSSSGPQKSNKYDNGNDSSSWRSTNNNNRKRPSEDFNNVSSGGESEEDSVWARKQRWRGSRWNGKGKYKKSYCYDCGMRVLDPDDPECACTMDGW